jgi:N-succinyl-L-ornithine transcarbamylase
LSDLLTIEEVRRREGMKRRPKVVLSWAPHPKALPQAVPNSFAEWMLRADVDFVITHPEGYELDEIFTQGASVITNQDEALRDADFVYAKNWSAFRGENYGKVLSKDPSWKITAEKMHLTREGKFMHCLPTRRNVEVADEVNRTRFNVQAQGAMIAYSKRTLNLILSKNSLDFRGNFCFLFLRHISHLRTPVIN